MILNDIVLSLHQGFARVLLLYSLFLLIWAFVAWLRSSAPSGGLLGAVVILEGVAALQGLLGLTLLAQGHHPRDELHFIYGIVAVLTLPSAYFWLRDRAGRRDTLVLAIAALVMFVASIRGIMTGG